jgi:hypothetical protein
MQAETNNRSGERRALPTLRRVPHRSGRARYRELQREARRRRHRTNVLMIASIGVLLALVDLFYKLLT